MWFQGASEVKELEAAEESTRMAVETSDLEGRSHVVYERHECRRGCRWQCRELYIALRRCVVVTPSEPSIRALSRPSAQLGASAVTQDTSGRDRLVMPSS